ATFDSPEFGILRVIVDKPELARDILVEKGYLLKITNVIAVNLVDRPGELDKVLEVIENAGLNLNYIYSFVIREDNSPLLVMHIDDLEIAKQILTEHGVKMGSLED
ncbi:MAG: amino acid-binding protein, partial [Clostridiales bacterium]|nr:amino acid-binding protein [Clostridiales bacterium]